MKQNCKSHTFDQGVKNARWEKNGLFNTWCWGNWIFTLKRMKLDPYFTPLKKINLKWIKNLKIRPETIKLPEENRKKFPDISLNNDFLDMTPKKQATEQKPSGAHQTGKLPYSK